MKLKNSIASYFEFQALKTSFKNEFIAGLTTFVTMAYILSVNPFILSSTGMDMKALITATALSAAIGTLYMGIKAKLPIGLAPGMGLNAFFAYSVVIGMGHSWRFALTAVFLEGLIFIGLTFFNIREALIEAIPINLKRSISAGIGLFITLIGLVNGGIIETGMKVVPGGDGALTGIVLKLANMGDPSALLTIAGIFITSFFLLKEITGGMLLAIFLTTLLGLPLGITTLPENREFLSMPPSLAPIFCQFEWQEIFSLDMLYVLLTFLFVDMFDTIGTLVGVSQKAGLTNKDGKIVRVKDALMADAIGTTVGALLGTSTVTSYVESAAGVSQGGKSGFTAVVVAIFFLLSLFFAPIFVMIPKEATAAVLILVGLFMFSGVRFVDLQDYTEALPAFLTIIMMPLTYSIADGIAFGILSFIFLKILSFRFKEIPLPMWFIALFFLIKLVPFSL